MSESKYIVGIDLGTTNCTLGFAPLQEEGELNVQQFAIPQIVAGGVLGESSSLPSFIYFPLPKEIEAQKNAFSWDSSAGFYIGAFAQERGAEIPSRLIASAKSWICHTGIDRRQPVLPFASDDVQNKMSPLEACSEQLRYLREAWDSKMDCVFAKQRILITVPASFDPSARQLVQEAAEKAGYPDVLLLEEPQAAFYAWLHAHAKDWRSILKVGDCVLVIDIGGGTTDFSLISVEEQGGDLVLQRMAVGSHLLLGGDNMDLALAYYAKTKLEDAGHSIDDWQLQSLIHSCRKGKELLLGPQPPKHVDITLAGRGSRLIGASVKTKLTLQEIQSIIVDGFSPLVSLEDSAAATKRSGLQQMGLPYAQDARLTAQLAKFLSMTGEGGQGLDGFVMPTVVLFNGGATKSTALRSRMIEQLNSWAAQFNKPPVKELVDADYDFAVSRGAVSYARAREGQAIRIKSGTSRSFFIGVEQAGLAIPGVPPQLKAVCIAPFGLEEGSQLELDKQEFALTLGEMATFRFFSHATPKLPSGAIAEMGTIVKNWKLELTELHSIETRLDSKEGDGKTIPVKIRTCVTELGVLEVWCMANDGRKWKLEFDIRKEEALIP